MSLNHPAVPERRGLKGKGPTQTHISEGLSEENSQLKELPVAREETVQNNELYKSVDSRYP